jgi:hypothetical protein
MSKFVKMSKYLSLNVKDLAKGLMIAFLTALFTGLIELFQAGDFVFDWPTFEPIVYSAISATLAYLIKNFFTNSANMFMKREPIVLQVQNSKHK